MSEAEKGAVAKGHRGRGAEAAAQAFLRGRGLHFSRGGARRLLDKAGDCGLGEELFRAALQCDLRADGAAALGPDAETVATPLYLQVADSAAVRDITRPRCEAGTGSAARRGGGRTLVFDLTDGHATFRAVELSPVASLRPDALVPGTKLRLEGLVRVRNRMLLLTPENTGRWTPAPFSFFLKSLPSLFLLSLPLPLRKR